MDNSIIEINSDTIFENIENHFKVSAGPGAGKTYWLVNHIKNVIHKSTRLGNCRKIACITYTNIAVDTILNRLGTHIEKVEVATIHSFLYNNVIKPFAFLIPNEYGLNIRKIDGHDDIPINSGLIYKWKERTKQIKTLDDDAKIIEALNDLCWKFNTSNELEVKIRNRYKQRIGKYSIRNDSIIEYKKLYWEKGYLDHEDVLFFSYTLIKNNPRILEVIRAKFPYFFIDEFQDTNPIQTKIIKKISENETIIGVIGDIAQSIYRFQGAEPEQFLNFSLPNINNYSISDNFRSTIKIIELLNIIRKDIQQQSKRNINGSNPYILIGNNKWAFNKAKEISGNSVWTLSRNNITSNSMKNETEVAVSNENLLNKLFDSDNNSQRSRIIIACVKAIEFSRQKKYKDSIKELTKILKKFWKYENDTEVRNKALFILKSFLSNYIDFYSKTLTYFYDYISRILPFTLTRLKSGNAKTFYDSQTYLNFSISVNIKEDTSFHKTIHKAKGAEFANVMLILNDVDKNGLFLEKDELSFIISPDLNDTKNEEQRIKYVGVSRAKNNLFINIPSLTSETKTNLQNIGFDLIFENT